jgi:hypothetical protein
VRTPRAAQASAMRVFVEDAAQKEGIISDVRAQEKTLLVRRMRQRDEHVGNILPAAISGDVRRAHSIRARKRFQQRSNVIAKLSIVNPCPFQDVPGQDVEIKFGRDGKMFRAGENRIHQPRIVQDGIARFRITQQINQ